ncbi:MAG: DNA/RNA non-specific endonuclease [Erysipelotrichaceae bacterium]|nr:DNA/RNA non-specific endonuclease [Erysipelotrichaceae bacterium]
MKRIGLLGLVLLLGLGGFWIGRQTKGTPDTSVQEDIRAYRGDLTVVLEDNQPGFSEEEKEQKEPFLQFEALDSLGRTQRATALLTREMLPPETETRSSIGIIKPSGWQTVRYDDLIEDNYLYNRCHLIAWSLCGENDNERNLITGTHAMNHEGMLPYEQQVLYYIRESGQPVLYRVTPVYEQEELVCRGVQMEAYSIHDQGKSICFNVFCYNVQPGIQIDYLTGESKREQQKEENTADQTFVLNTRSRKFHSESCPNAGTISPRNKEIVHSSIEKLLAEGYQGAGCCIKQ